MKACVCTVVTADHFQHYIPIFCYTLQRAVKADVRVLVRGQLDELTKLGIIASGCNPTIMQDTFKGFPENPSTTNSLRFLLPGSTFTQYDWVYLTDVDFVFLSHEPDFLSYYAQKADLWGEDYWSRRGPKRASGTDERAKRIAGGCMMARAPEWFRRTVDMRAKMMKRVESGEIGKFREDDERMLWDICAGSGMKCPTKKGNRRAKCYKEIHLGDFKFDGRWGSNRKMAKRISHGNYLKWFRLEDDPVWKRVCSIVEQDPEIKRILTNVREYMNGRRARGRLGSPDLET